jgi:roadblock/LC7 domain-containing protein
MCKHENTIKMMVNVDFGGCHITLALCAGGCVLSTLTAIASDKLQKYFVCANGQCPAGVFTDHMRHSFESIFIASTILAATFGYDALASLLRCLNIVLSFEASHFGRLVMYSTHVSNVVLGSFMLAACYTNSFVFDSTYTSLKGSEINKIKLYILALFILAIGSALFQHMLSVVRAHERAVKKASTLGDMSSFLRQMHRKTRIIE